MSIFISKIDLECFLLFGVICVMFRYSVYSGFIKQREAFCPFLCSGIVCGFRFIRCDFLSLAPL